MKALFFSFFCVLFSPTAVRAAGPLDGELTAKAEATTGLAPAKIYQAVALGQKASTVALLKYLVARGTGPLFEDAELAVRKARARCAGRKAIDCGDEASVRAAELAELRTLEKSGKGAGKLSEKVLLAVLAYREQVSNEVLQQEFNLIRRGCRNHEDAPCRRVLERLGGLAEAMNDLSVVAAAKNPNRPELEGARAPAAARLRERFE